MEQVEFNELIANRQAPGDNWVLVGDDTKTVYTSLTSVLEAWFDKNQEKAEFRSAPLDNIYGDY